MISVKIESNIVGEKKGRRAVHIIERRMLSKRASWGEGAWWYFIGNECVVGAQAEIKDRSPKQVAGSWLLC
jgi:hypothetical protein